MYLAAKNAGLRFAKEKKAAYSDVIWIGTRGRRLKHAAEEFWICCIVISLLILVQIIILRRLLLNYVIRHLNLSRENWSQTLRLTNHQRIA